MIQQKDFEILYFLRRTLGFGKIFSSSHENHNLYRFIVADRITILRLIHLYNGNLVLKKSNRAFAKWIKTYNALYRTNLILLPPLKTGASLNAIRVGLSCGSGFSTAQGRGVPKSEVRRFWPPQSGAGGPECGAFPMGSSHQAISGHQIFKHFISLAGFTDRSGFTARAGFTAWQSPALSKCRGPEAPGTEYRFRRDRSPEVFAELANAHSPNPTLWSWTAVLVNVKTIRYSSPALAPRSPHSCVLSSLVGGPSGRRSASAFDFFPDASPWACGLIESLLCFSSNCLLSERIDQNLPVESRPPGNLRSLPAKLCGGRKAPADRTPLPTERAAGAGGLFLFKKPNSLGLHELPTALSPPFESSLHCLFYRHEIESTRGSSPSAGLSVFHRVFICFHDEIFFLFLAKLCSLSFLGGSSSWPACSALRSAQSPWPTSSLPFSLRAVQTLPQRAVLMELVAGQNLRTPVRQSILRTRSCSALRERRVRRLAGNLRSRPSLRPTASGHPALATGSAEPTHPSQLPHVVYSCVETTVPLACEAVSLILSTRDQLIKFSHLIHLFRPHFKTKKIKPMTALTAWTAATALNKSFALTCPRGFPKASSGGRTPMRSALSGRGGVGFAAKQTRPSRSAEHERVRSIDCQTKPTPLAPARGPLRGRGALRNVAFISFRTLSSLVLLLQNSRRAHSRMRS